MTYEDLILNHMETGSEYTTEFLTEILFSCKKGDARYNNYVDDVSKDLQKLSRKGIISKERFNTGRGYYINRWRLV